MTLWDTYLKDTKNSNPRPLLVEALSYVKEHNRVLDLGCGALNDERTLFDAGFNSIDAVDSNPSIRELAEQFPEYNSRLYFYAKKFSEFEFPNNSYDLVSAQFSLPFISPSDFDSVWKEIVSSISSGGVFTGNFFGPHDAWAYRPNMSFHSKDKVESLFPHECWDMHTFIDKEYDRPTAAGEPKHWHVINVIATKLL
ncbi:class I SAM-dependent methyltransferase [soil metagenome]